VANFAGMRFWIARRLVSVSFVAACCGIAACSGNLGSGSVGGLPVAPGAQGYQQPQGPAQAAPVSRERTTEGAVYVTPELSEIPLPAEAGFALTLALAPPSPPPPPSPGAVPSGAASPATRILRQPASRVVVVAQAALLSPSPSASLLPAASPSAAPSAASPASSGAASPPVPGAAGSSTAKPSAAPSQKAAARPKIATKLVIYPDYAPDAPTPEPTGNVQTFSKRRAIVRGYLFPSVDVPLYGLGAARFTIPAGEQTPNRGFTVAIFTAAKRHKEHAVAFDASASLANNVVSSSLVTPLTLKKGTGYDIVLYGDDLPATPVPVQSGYATPGNNPFVTPTPPGYQPYPGQTPMPGQATYPGQTPYPGQPYPGQPYPGYTPTPFPGH